MGSPFDQMVLNDAKVFQDGAGESITYTPKGQPAFSIIGIFTESHEEVVVQDGVPISSVKPTLDVVLADFGERRPRQEDEIEREGTTYQVADVEPDGYGMAKLILVKR